MLRIDVCASLGDWVIREEKNLELQDDVTPFKDKSQQHSLTNLKPAN